MVIRLSEQQVLDATRGSRARSGNRASFEAITTDSRSVPQGALFVALKGERFDGHDHVEAAAQAGAAGVVVKRGQAVTLQTPAVAVYEVDDTLVALGALAHAHRLSFKIPIGAVTGSNGKTGTKELVASILETRGPALKTKGNLNNEIGVPLTLLGLEARHVAAIVEMGMNHAGEISRLTAIAEPDAGLITVVQPAHLEGLGSIDGVADAKTELFRGLKASATAVVNLDDERIASRAKGLKCRTLTFGRSSEADVRLVRVSPKGREGLLLLVRAQAADWPLMLPLVGEHNAMNATGAFALALALGYSPSDCVRGLESAQAHARRLQLLTARSGLTVVDDCYNANPASMTAALKTLPELARGGRTVAVLGDMLELGSAELEAHEAMGEVAAASAALVAFFGQRMAAAHHRAKATLGGAAAHFTDVGQLLEWLRPQLVPSDVVLVKGSRGMRLERVVEDLTGLAGGGH